MKITREHFKNLTKDFNNYQTCLSPEQNLILSMYLEGNSYVAISKRINISTARIGQIIRGENKFGKNGIYRKLISAKRNLNIN